MTTLQTIQRLFTADEIRAMFTSRKFDRIFVDCALGEHGKEQLSDNDLAWEGFERAKAGCLPGRSVPAEERQSDIYSDIYFTERDDLCVLVLQKT